MAAMRLPHRPTLLLLILGLVVCVLSQNNCRKNDTLHIQGFFPGDNDVYTSPNIVPAAMVAVEEINCNQTLLPNYHIELNFSNTKCDASEATWQLIQAVLNRTDHPQPTRIMFLGGGCAPATEPLAALSGRFYNVSQISYGSSSPTLSDRDMFPKFFRTIPSETQSNSARFALMQRYNWTKVATLHETRNVFTLTVEDFRTQFDKLYNTSDNGNDNQQDELVTRSFTDDPEIPLRQIKEKDIRIIMGFFYEDKAVRVLCEAYHMNLTTRNHLWMFPAWYRAGWWNTSVEATATSSSKNCTREQMQEAVTFSLFLDSYNYGLDPNATTDTGSDNQTFSQKYHDKLVWFLANSSLASQDDQNPHAYRTFTYDAVYAMAFALNKSENELQMNGFSLSDFMYSDTVEVRENTTISDVIFQHMNETNFHGVSGHVRFDVNGSRIGLNAIYQLRNDTESGELELVQLAVHSPDDANSEGLYNYTLNFMLDPLWKGGEPPKDRPTPVEMFLNPVLIYICDVFTGISILVAVVLLIFNIVTIQKPLIKDSAPFINIIVTIGCIMMLIACILLGIDSQTPLDESSDKSRYGAICNARLWLLTFGFTLSFGSLFAKTWQVYRIYTNSKLKNEPFKMWNFLIIIGIFLLIDAFYMSFWTGFDRFVWRQERQPGTEDQIVIYEQCHCRNFGYLIGALYVYKGLIVIFGLFLAYESRNVKYHYINDSRFVSISVYIVVILVGIGAPLSLVLAVHFFIDPAYGLAVFMIIVSCMACLLIIYVPKFYYMAKGLDTMVQDNPREEVTVSDGLQLGRSIADQTDPKDGENEGTDPTTEDREKQVLDEEGGVETTMMKETQMTSDRDSGTGDEIFSTESTMNGGEQQQVNPTPTTMDNTSNTNELK